MKLESTTVQRVTQNGITEVPALVCGGLAIVQATCDADGQIIDDRFVILHCATGLSLSRSVRMTLRTTKRRIRHLLNMGFDWSNPEPTAQALQAVCSDSIYDVEPIAFTNGGIPFPR